MEPRAMLRLMQACLQHISWAIPTWERLSGHLKWTFLQGADRPEPTPHEHPDQEQSSSYFWAMWQWEESPFSQWGPGLTFNQPRLCLSQCLRKTKQSHETEKHRLTGGIAEVLQSPPTPEKNCLGSVHSIICHLEALRLPFFQNNLGPSVYLSRNSSWIFAVCCSSVWKASIIKSRKGKTKADLSAGQSPTAKRKQRKQTICEQTRGWMFLAVNDQWTSLNTNSVQGSQDQFVNDLLI